MHTAAFKQVTLEAWKESSQVTQSDHLCCAPKFSLTYLDSKLLGLLGGIEIHWYSLLTRKKEKQEPATCSDNLLKQHFSCLYAGLLTSRNENKIQISTDLKSVTLKLAPVSLLLKEFVRTLSLYMTFQVSHCLNLLYKLHDSLLSQQ